MIHSFPDPRKLPPLAARYAAASAGVALLVVILIGLTRADVKSIIIYGFKRSFFPGSYQRKRQYVRQVIDYYDSVVADFECRSGRIQ